MSFEEHIEYHEQWLRAMESNQLQMSEHLASVDRRFDRFAELVVTAAQTQAWIMQSQARTETNLEALTASQRGGGHGPVVVSRDARPAGAG